jgi:integrase
MARPRRITGHVVLEDRASGRVWVAKYRRAEGTPTRKVLGRAWAKAPRKEPERGAPAPRRWRAADGPKPAGHLTPQEAQDALDALLAVERAKDAQAARTRRTHGTHGAKTFSQACEAYLEHLERVKQVTPSTLTDRKSVVRAHLLPAFGEDTPLRRVSTARVEGLRDDLLDNDDLSRARMLRIMDVLHGVFKQAHKKGWLASDPAADVERIPQRKASGDFNVLTPTEVEAVARAAAEGWKPVDAGDRISENGQRTTRVSEPVAAALTGQRRADAELYAAIIRFAAFTGLRLGEIRALRWQDIDWRARRVHVRRNAPSSAPGNAEKAPKSDLVRSVPLTDQAGRVVEALSHREHFTGDSDRVFPSPTGGVIDGGKIRDAFYDALAAAGLGHLREKDEPIVWHDTRHTFGTQCAARGIALVKIQHWMGHSDIRTTMRYLHYAPAHDDAALLTAAFAIESNPLAASADTGADQETTVDVAP